MKYWIHQQKENVNNKIVDSVEMKLFKLWKKFNWNDTLEQCFRVHYLNAISLMNGKIELEEYFNRLKELLTDLRKIAIFDFVQIDALKTEINKIDVWISQLEEQKAYLGKR